MIVYVRKQDGQILDISQLTSEKRWSGEKQKACRTLEFDVLKTSEADVDAGDLIYLFNNNKEELFRGLAFRKGFSSIEKYSIKAYDSMIYWANNNDSLTFNNVTADTIFKTLCHRFQIPCGSVANTSFAIPELNEDNTTLFDIMRKALSITYKQTGKRFYMRDNKGQAELIQRSNNVHNMILELNTNIFRLDYSESIEDLRNKVKLVYEVPEAKNVNSASGGRKAYSKQGAIDKSKKLLIATQQNDDLIKKFGLFQLYQKVSDKINPAQAQQRAIELLRQHAKIKNEISLEVVGVDSIISGDAVVVNIPQLNINKTYYVDSDRHVIKNNLHTMSLKLNETNEL